MSSSSKCRVAQHYLIVYGWIEEEEAWDWEIEHPDDCPTDELLIGVQDYVCAVGMEVSNGGLEFTLNYSGTPIPGPGRFPISAWSDKITGFDYVEYDGGLALATEDEVCHIES